MIHYNNEISTKIKGLLNICLREQEGLIDITLDPDYAQNTWIYFSYASPKGITKSDTTAISRATIPVDQSDLEELYKAYPNSKKRWRLGFQLTYIYKGYFYFSVGDREKRDENPQNIRRNFGKPFGILSTLSILQENPYTDRTEVKETKLSFRHPNSHGTRKNIWTTDICAYKHGTKSNSIQESNNCSCPLVGFGLTNDKTKLIAKA